MIFLYPYIFSESYYDWSFWINDASKRKYYVYPDMILNLFYFYKADKILKSLWIWWSCSWFPLMLDCCISSPSWQKLNPLRNRNGSKGGNFVATISIWWFRPGINGFYVIDGNMSFPCLCKHYYKKFGWSWNFPIKWKDLWLAFKMLLM